MKKIVRYRGIAYGSVIMLIFWLQAANGYSQEPTETGQAFGSLSDTLTNIHNPAAEKNKKFFFGGMAGFRFGTITDIQLTPLTGYRLTPRVALGLGFKYEYYSEKTIYYRYNTHIYGPRVFFRYLFIESFSNVLNVEYNGGLFFEAEAEALSLEKKYFDYPDFSPEGRFWLDSYFVGLGLRQPVDHNSAVNFIILYNINNVEYSPYTNPIFRIEMTF